MSDLGERTGLPRQVVHFYVKEGLLPPPHKTGRNMAYYGEEHLERLHLVRRLQEERFLPLRAIKALIDGAEGAFAAPQQRLLAEVRRELGSDLAPPRPSRPAAGAALLRKAGVDRRDLEALAAAGLVRIESKRPLRIAHDDAWVVELWGEVRRAGFSRELGFEPEVLGIFERAVSAMFSEEARLLVDRLLGQVSPADAARLVERALPLIHRFVSRYHESKVRELFAAM